MFGRNRPTNAAQFAAVVITMVHLDLTGYAVSKMEAEQRRTSRVVRSRGTIQTAVDHAVVNSLVTVDIRCGPRSKLQDMHMRVNMLLDQIEDERRTLLMTERVSWVAHRQRYYDWIIVVCLALKFSIHEFERHRFQRLLLQHNCAGACELGIVLGKLMESNVHSGVYCLFKLGQRTTYWGQWQGSDTWSNRDRYEQHVKATLQAHAGINSEHKYAYMSDHGGAAK